MLLPGFLREPCWALLRASRFRMLSFPNVVACSPLAGRQHRPCYCWRNSWGVRPLRLRSWQEAPFGLSSPSILLELSGILRIRIPAGKLRAENDLAQSVAPRAPLLAVAQHAEKSTQMIRTSNSMTAIPKTSTANATASYSSQIGMIPPTVRSQLTCKMVY